MENDALTDEVKAIGNLNFEGNIVPLEWFSYLKTDNKKPDTIAILILSDIVYWYRPTTIRDEITGKIITYKKKFKADLLQRSYNDFENLFGFSEKQIREALIRLENFGILQRVLRHIDVCGKKIPNVMYIKIFPEVIAKITTKVDPSLEGTISLPRRNHMVTSEESYPSSKGNTNTKSTTKNTTKNSLSLEKQSKDKTKEREMLEIWNKIVAIENKVTHLTFTRKNLLLEKLQTFFNNNIALWKDYCIRIASSKFLMGEVTNFKVQLEWALKDENLIKILENAYNIGDRSTKSWVLDTYEDIRQEIYKDNCPEIWKKIKENYLNEFGVEIYKSWFHKLEFDEFHDGVLKIKATTPFIKNYLLQHFGTKMHNICNRILDGFSNLSITSSRT